MVQLLSVHQSINFIQLIETNIYQLVNLILEKDYMNIRKKKIATKMVICPHCGKEFKQKRSSQILCSKKCSTMFTSKENVIKALKTRKLNGNLSPMVERKCQYCKKSFQSRERFLKRFCSTSCSAKWRMEQPEIRKRVYTKESSQKISKAILKSYAINPELKEHLSKRMMKNNPMFQQINIEKMKEKRGKYTFLSRGGNGQITKQQLLLFSKISGDTYMEMELAIPILTPLRKLGIVVVSPPTHYKVDIGIPSLKLAIEVDGNTHKTKKWKFLDKRKTEILALLGWKILRFWNQEIEKDLKSVVVKIKEYMI